MEVRASAERRDRTFYAKFRENKKLETRPPPPLFINALYLKSKQRKMLHGGAA